MIEALSFITPVHVAFVPIVVGIVSALRALTLADTSRFAPIASIVIGVGLSALIGGGAMDVIVGGLFIGLSASGLYSGTSAVIRG